ncbi:tyrosine-type recombinase/integrase [Sporosarcina siberiensis]|uniref:Tyrosine-type recombinase/integrase n=1 Tax=Sporosarcina siberiensis TaxID=1365606 RepID=A0ABW4SC58_9BACL
MSKRKTINPALLAEINKAAGRDKEVETPVVSFDEAVESFLNHGVIKGLSPDTVASYQKELKQLRRAFAELNVGLSDIRNLTTDDYTAFVMNQIEAGFARTTINTRLRSGKIFGNYCVRKGFIDVNVASEVATLKVRHKIGATFTQAQLKRLLSEPDISTFSGLRDLTIMMMFTDTGIRVSELAAINMQDVILSDRSLNLQRTKNRYARRIPLTKRLQAMLTAYMKVRGVTDLTDALFITEADTRLAVITIQYRIRLHGRNAGVINEVQCSPHVFRRSFAKFKIQAGVDIFTLQKLMGHSDINELRKYVAIYSTDLDAAIEKGIE